MHMDEEQMNQNKYEDLKIDRKSTSEISTECFLIHLFQMIKKEGTALIGLSYSIS